MKAVVAAVQESDQAAGFQIFPSMSKRVAPLSIEVPAMASSFWGKGIVNLTIQTPTSSRGGQREAAKTKARWKTPEFLFHGIVVALAVSAMIYIPITLSQRMY